MDVAGAGIEELDGIEELVEFYSNKGVLTPRTSGYLKRHLKEFYACKVDGRLAGCCALHQINDEVAEVRCFAVKDEYKGRGVGKALLDRCLEDAKAKKLRLVFTLSLEKEFFRKNGFTRMSKMKIPPSTFKNEPEPNPTKIIRWITLFLKMLTTDSAHERRIN